MAYGFVYILTNEAMPGIVKIGCTERSPAARAAELSGSTSVPLSFCVYGFVEVKDCQGAEQFVHAKLDRYRVSKNREFFRLGALHAIRLIFDMPLDHLSCAVSSRYHADVEENRKTAEWAQEWSDREEIIDAMFGDVHDCFGDGSMQDSAVVESAGGGAADNILAFRQKAA